jgi:hypothetical protein
MHKIKSDYWELLVPGNFLRENLQRLEEGFRRKVRVIDI